MNTRTLFYLFIFSLSSSLFSQNSFTQTNTVTVVSTSEKVKIDGVLDEAVWKDAMGAKDFWQYFPDDTSLAEAQTEIYLASDDQFLYVGFICYAISDNYVVPSLRRDYRAGGSDNITLLFDTFNDKTNAFVFGLNPMGVRREALIANGGASFEDFSDSWDNKWYGTSKIYNGYWIGEMAIPFKSIRFNEGGTKWRFGAYRFDTQSNERSTWPRIPREQSIITLAFMGDMIWEKPLQKPGKNLVVIPYLAGGITKSHIDGEVDPNFTYNAGADAKIAVTPGLNLDLTINPDFSQVEVDRQVTNLDRFEIFFPERRQFFLENADLFASFGTDRIRPFFSRRIGVARDTATGNNIQNPIYFGARLSGKLDDNLRIGLLNMQTARDESNGLPSLNYTVGVLQRKVFSRSNISFIAVNKQALHRDSSKTFSLGAETFNRVAGLDYNLASADNRWTGKFFYHRSFDSEDTVGNNFAHGGRLSYNGRLFQLRWAHEQVGEGFDARVGFVPRHDYFRIDPRVQVSFYPTGKVFNRHQLGVQGNVIWNRLDGRTDHRINAYWEISFANTQRLEINFSNRYTYLFSSFDPTRTGGPELPEGSEYSYNSVNVSFNSDRRKVFSYRISPQYGEYFNGKRWGGNASLTYRFQPYGNLSVRANFNRIILPDSFATANLFLIGPRLDLTLSKNIFFTALVQYNNQIDNININARFQWRFKPVSDFFIVYTDNYYASDLTVKNRGIVAKLTYWLNM